MEVDAVLLFDRAMDVKYSLAVEVGDDSGAAEETENELT